MRQRVRENHLGDKWCFYLKQLVLSVGWFFFNFLIGLEVVLVQHVVAVGILNLQKWLKLVSPVLSLPPHSLAGKQKATSISDVPFQQDELRAAISPISLRVVII